MADPHSLLPSPFSSSPSSTTPPPVLITQGAEALLFRTTFLSSTTACALKVRPRKAYRHPTLDARLTRTRLLAEARVLVRCRRMGVSVPGVLGLDWEAGWMAVEWVYGRTVRQVLDERIHDAVSCEAVEADGELARLMGRVGAAIGRMHDVAVVHGDLTTSNLMVRDGGSAAGEAGGESLGKDAVDGEVVIIDFGLGVQSVQDEDRAVDLYVLERAFISTHPLAEGLFKELLRAYAESFRGGNVVLKRLEDVRQRGRKKSMLG